MPTTSLDDELIQRNETRFFDIPIDTARPFIMKAQEDHRHLDRAGGSKPLTPGRAFHLNAIEKEGLREARKTGEVAQAIEKHVIDSIKDLVVKPPVPEEPEDEPETGYNGDGDSDSEDYGYRSYADSGEDEVVDSDWWGENNNPISDSRPQEQPSPQIHPDEDLWEVQLVDADVVLQDALYYDIVTQPPTNRPPLLHTTIPSTPRKAERKAANRPS